MVTLESRLTSVIPPDGYYPSLVSVDRLSQEAHDIFTFYDVEAELSFVKNLPEKLRRRYLEEQIFKSVGEFVFGLKLQRIFYRIEGEKLYALAVDKPAEESYKRAAENSLRQGYLREQAELEGFQKIQSALVNGAKLIIYVSPPSIGREGFGSYLFVQVWRKIGDLISVDLVRVEGEDERLEKSRTVFMEALTKAQEKGMQVEAPDIFDLVSTEDFLRTPLVIEGEKKEAFLRSLNFYNENLAKEEEGLKELLFGDQIFSSFFEEYIQALQRKNLEEAKIYLIALHKRAEEIKKVRETGGEEVVYLAPQQAAALAFHYASQPMQLSGGSCPVTPSVETSQHLLQHSEGRLDYSLASAITGEGEKVLKCVKCPSCHEVVDAIVKNGEIVCPNCGARKKI